MDTTKQLPKFRFSAGELCLWLGSSLLILGSFFLFGSRDLLTLLASLIGAASLIFCANCGRSAHSNCR